jgi:hypothetical protein
MIFVVQNGNWRSVFSFRDHNRDGWRDGINKVKGMVDLPYLNSISLIWLIIDSDRYHRTFPETPGTTFLFHADIT